MNNLFDWFAATLLVALWALLIVRASRRMERDHTKKRRAERKTGVWHFPETRYLIASA